MAQSVDYTISVDSKVNVLNVTAFVVQSVTIQNYSGDNVIFDNTIDPLLVIPPGVVAPINIYHLIYTLRFRTATNTTGYVHITLYDSQQDVSHAPPLQQLPGTVTISGSVGIPSSVAVTGPGGGNVGTSDTTVQSLLADVKTLITATNSLDTDIKALIATVQTNTLNTASNTGTLLGLLPQSTQQILGINNQTKTITFTTAVTFFLFQLLNVRRDGTVDVFYTANGNVVYLIEQMGIISSMDVPIPITKPIPAGATLSVAFTGDGDFQVAA